MRIDASTPRRRNILVLAIAAPWLCFAIVRTFGLDFFWPLVPVVSFTALALITAAIPLVVSLLLRAWIAAFCVLLAAAALGAAIAPRTSADEQPAAVGPSFKILSANLALGGSDTGVLAREILSQQPDVVALQEVSFEDLADLHRRRIMRQWRYVAGRPQPGSKGYAMLSRTKLAEIPGTELSPGAWPLYRVGGFDLLVRNVHPNPPLKARVTPGWKRTLDSIQPPQRTTTIIVGDFNATLDHRAFRSVLSRGYRDAADQLGQGLTPTWMPQRVTRLTIDHILGSAGVRFTSYRTVDLPGSDHRMIVAQMRLP